MKMNKLFTLLVVSVLITSCNRDKENTYTIPETYQFSDKMGNNTVSFSGQTTRFNQLSEITTYMKTANTPGVSLSETQLLEMYSNNSGLGSTYFSVMAGAAGKQLREKTARNEPLIIGRFDERFKNIATISATTQTGVYGAQLGSPGVLQSGTSAYLVNDKGAEYTQLIEKGLMGAVFYDQIQNFYLGADKMNLDNSTSVDATGGLYYTAMEHSWDEAFGYFTEVIDYPTSGTDRFWGKYSNLVDPILQTNSKIMLAFRTGRAAISNKDYSTRDNQINIIRGELERVAAGAAIHYLNQSIIQFTDDALRSHYMSETAGFIETLYFTNTSTAIISGTSLDNMLLKLKDNTGAYNFYEITLQEIVALRDDIATAMGWSDIKLDL